MPTINRLLETALYVDDLQRAAKFYQDVFGFKAIDTPGVPSSGKLAEERLIAMEVPGRTVLLLFRKGSCTTTAVLPGGTIPPHDGSGRLHLAFAIEAVELDGWRERLEAREIPIEGETRWPLGGTSIYFRDPDGHLLELLTPGVWSIY